jgi:pSer/pThr/pTyr-binding forkhead associated (FHA) protein
MVLKLVQVLHGVIVADFPLSHGRLKIGRESDNQLQLDDTTVSSHHAVISATNNPLMDGLLDVFIDDLNSTNGTRVNDLPVTTQQRLGPGDVIKIGIHEFKLIDDQNPQVEETRLYISEEEI